MIELEGAAIAFGGCTGNISIRRQEMCLRSFDHHSAPAVATVGQHSSEIDAFDARPYR